MQGEISFIISSPEGPWIFSMYQIKKKMDALLPHAKCIAEFLLDSFTLRIVLEKFALRAKFEKFAGN